MSIPYLSIITQIPCKCKYDFLEVPDSLIRKDFVPYNKEVNYLDEKKKDQRHSALVTIAKRTVDCGNGISLNNNYYGTFDSYGNRFLINLKQG